MKDDKLYLIHIAECIERIESYTIQGQEAFKKSSMAQDAVARNFEIIGEAVKRISQTLKQKHPDVPWQRIAGLRDVLIHDYISVDLDEVWSIVQQNVPPFKKKLETILRDTA